MIIRASMPLLALSCVAAAPVPFTDLATPFERTALATTGQPEMDRVAAVRRALSISLPGVYSDGAATDRRLARALADFPADLPSANNIADFEAYDVAPSKFAIDRDVEQRSITKATMMVQVEADAPYLFRFQRALRTNFAPGVPSLPVAGAGIIF